jgi:hypothetical protein
MNVSRRHFICPDTQVKPGDPTDHFAWVGQALVDYKPDVIVHIGDHWDMHSLSSHDGPGSMSKEGSRYEDDIAAGNEAFKELVRPMRLEQARLLKGKRKAWEPDENFLLGNHENRIDRAIEADPRFAGTIGTHQLDVQGFKKYPFLHVIERDGVYYSHYFQMEKSNRPIGGSMDNRFNKICASFVCGHEQGYLVHRRPLPIGRTLHGIVAGSCYIHDEGYRGEQRNNDWRGIVILNDVRNGGDCEPMPLTLDYLCRRYEKMSLGEYLRKKYKNAESRFTLARAA